MKSEVTVAQVSVSTEAGAGESRITAQLLGYVVTWILPALASLLIIWLALSLTDFYYPHAWVSAHIATIAHSFVTHGIIGLHGIPIENFDPLTTQPDNYLHWPPFFYYVLSLVLRAFPDSIRAMHLFMAVIAIANAYVMWIIASMFFKPRVAIVCGSAFLLMPATLRYGLILVPANLAMLEVSVALLFMLRYLQGADAGREKLLNLGLSAFAFFLACITSWEPFLALPGLLLACVFNRRSEILKTCVCWTIAAIAAGASTLAIFSLSDSTFFWDLWSIFTFRLGLTQYLPLPARVHPVEGQLETIDGLNVFSSPSHFFEAYVIRTQLFCGSLGIIGIFALLLTALRRRGIPNNFFAALLLPLCTFWLGWAVIMQGHYIIHEYQLILASPILAIGVTCIYSLLDDTVLATQDSWPRENLAMLTNLALPCALLFLGISAAAITIRGEEEAWQLANFGRLIKAEVPTGAVVLTSEMSMVQTYYAERHVIRGVPDGAHLESKLGMIPEICHSCALYLAVRRQSVKKFRDVLDRLQPVFEDDNFIIKKISLAEHNH
ncbi:MAG TPA: glycosyltransferase family 39 protein [Nitrosospira sp.]|nr:glycosyltransferase family 39 protein [Nitrosospira sp.]